MKEKHTDDQKARCQGSETSPAGGNASSAEGSRAKQVTKAAEEKLANVLAQIFAIFGEELTADAIPVKTGDLIKAEYTTGKFLADVNEVKSAPENYVQYTFRYIRLNEKVRNDSFADFLGKYNSKKIEIVNNEKAYLSANRPPYRAGLRDKVWANAVKESIANEDDGHVFDPNVRSPRIELFEKGRWDMGHRPGHEYRKLLDSYIKGDYSWEEFLDEYNDETTYQPEDPSSNRSHKFEAKNQ